MTETVLVVGATGNIGVATVIGALRSGRHVIAIVRNQSSADKLFKHVGSKEGIKTVEADVAAPDGVQRVVSKVQKGELPAFQHVYTCVGGPYSDTPLQEISDEELRLNFSLSFEANFFAYRATIPYLLSQKGTDTTFTMCTGSQGDAGQRPPPAMTQGALFSMANCAALANRDNNVRFNECYLTFRVEVDEDAEQHGVSKSSDFAAVYEGILSQKNIRSSRVSVFSPEDFTNLRVKSIPQVPTA
ncbi:hypothetical protein BAUCODRAFT_64800 [Baudoinia panamericana UAMH 10762]|uniref:NAD(P)-binding domain-containing protein n=1 Tax=Baudoinia panamericana (strain UAMH 10762) TaxID=717646 RepID=M2NIP6_BAUPA|nr:uncharacterized protein BAUCODRAFT_64800 [Baudoinia panamericana UAMH 10762]EMC99264.1 hypothetical protein BAUCODRAFT_64800 [Baudoinia panamericana UAMH 10762]